MLLANKPKIDVTKEKNAGFFAGIKSFFGAKKESSGGQTEN